jgi:membrane-associated phospholipid phosphatase
MTSFEWLAAIYFVLMPLSAARYARPRGWLYAAGALALVIVTRFAAPWPARAWLPHAYLVLGYWIPAVFTPGVNPKFEAWLAEADRRLGNGLSGVGRWPAKLRFELAYLLCYPSVPAAFAVVFIAGNREDITRFWIAVLLAGYACYGSLPWTAARPPRLISAPEPIYFARINAHVLGRVSHNLNTFPSGHVAVTLAAALVVCSLSMAWGLGFLAIATAVAVAAVNGRYHYLVDVLVGAGVGVAAVLTAVVLQPGGLGRGCPGG